MQPYAQLATGSAITATTAGFTTITGLSFNVAAGATYRFEVEIVYTGVTVTTSRFKASMGGTCTTSFVSYKMDGQNDAGGTSNHWVQAAISVAFATIPAVTGVTAASPTPYGYSMAGILTVNAAGTFLAQAGASGANCNVLAGSKMMLEQIG